MEPIGKIRTARPPWRFGTTPEVIHTQAAILGQHTTEILTELGYDQRAIVALRNAAVIAGDDID